jgi:transcriptional regulator with XRE-family HTH domain
VGNSKFWLFSANYPETIYMAKDFWNNVLSEISKRKWSQKELAALSGVSRTVINNGIGHHHKASVDNAFKIAKALETSVEQLMTGLPENGLTDDESEVLQVYRAIPKRGKEYALKQLKDTLERERDHEAETKAQVEAALAEDGEAVYGA